MTKDKRFYSDFFKICILLILQNVVSLSVNLADNIMLGAYSEAALTGVAAVNQVQFILQQVMLGFGDGLVVLASQYWGKKDLEPIQKIASIALRMGVVFVLLLFIVVSVFPHGVMHLFTRDAVIVAEGVSYLSIIRFTYLFFGMTSILLAALRSVETVKIAFFLSFSTLIVNCSLNYIFIYGNFSAPRMGARGAALGTLIARIVEFTILIIYILKKEKHFKLNIKDYITFDKKLFGDYLKISIPLVTVCVLWGATSALQTIILGHMTPTAIAANSIACTLFLMLKAVASGAASTASVLTGRSIGRGDFKKVQEYANTMQIMFLCIGVAISITLFFVRIPILGLYHIAPQTKAMANSFLLVLCVASIGSAYECPTITGILRGGGNTRFDLITDIVCVWGIGFPLALLAAYVFRLSPVVVVIFLNLDQIIKCIPAYIKVNKCKWIQNFTGGKEVRKK
ncbi:MAG: MATE family efflux transporter [Lachnospiraceae bacterium]